MPADASVEQARTCRLDRLGQQHDLIPCRAIGHEVDQRNAIDHDEVRADRLADAAHHFDRQTHPVLIGTAPVVGALVGVTHEELVQEIALGAHHLDAVIARLARAGGGSHDIGDLFLDSLGIKLFRREGRDRRLDRRGRDAFRPVGVAPGMQDLHRDPPASLMHAVRHHPVIGNVLLRKQPRGAGKYAPLSVRRHAARHHQPHTPARPRGIEFGHPVPVAGFLEIGVHRPHQHAILQRDMAQIERREHMRIMAHRFLPLALVNLRAPRAPVIQNAASSVVRRVEGDRNRHSKPNSIMRLARSRDRFAGIINRRISPVLSPLGPICARFSPEN